MTHNWRNLHYLRAGSLRQRRAFLALHGSGLWEVLGEFGPVLAGTVPLGVNIVGSDLDVLCEVPVAAQARFAALVQARFGAQPDFRLAQRLIGGYATTVAGFRYNTELIEVFGQALPTDQQLGWRHLLVERAVLAAGGHAWRTAVRDLKRQGLKTEPAFAQLLGLPGDPYATLLTLEDWPAEALRQWVAARVPRAAGLARGAGQRAALVCARPASARGRRKPGRGAIEWPLRQGNNRWCRPAWCREWPGRTL